MRAAIFRNGEIVVDTLPAPKPAAGQVLAKTLACGICGSDLHARKHAHRMVEMAKLLPGRKPMDLSRDVVFGHEFCCEIVDHGPATERKFKPGTRVCSIPALLTPQGPQGIGYSNDNLGAYAEQMLLSEALLLEVPNGLSPQHAALTEPLAVGVHAVAKANISGNEVPLVIGCGPVGLAVIAALRSRACTRSSLPTIRRRAALWPKSSALTSWWTLRARKPLRAGPSTPQCRRPKRPRGRRCRRCCRRSSPR
jgi:threonine dehydrogenase-like Zn-dependent dehydrogenase